MRQRASRTCWSAVTLPTHQQYHVVFLLPHLPYRTATPILTAPGWCRRTYRLVLSYVPPNPYLLPSSPPTNPPPVRLVLSYVQQPWFETPPASILKIVTIMHGELDGYPFR